MPSSHPTTKFVSDEEYRMAKNQYGYTRKLIVINNDI